MIEARVFNTRGVRDITPEIAPDGVLQVMPASFYSNTTLEERAIAANRLGAYVLPTTELIEWLRNFIDGRKAIEIGSGNGVVADALGIPGTDNKMQTWPEIRATYIAMQQPTVKYGHNVEQMDASVAVRHHKPDVVIACWVTHKWVESRPHVGGNAFGVVEEAIIENCKQYVLIGNEHVHRGKSIWSLPHSIEMPPWLYSRAHNGTKDFIAVWGNR